VLDWHGHLPILPLSRRLPPTDPTQRLGSLAVWSLTGGAAAGTSAHQRVRILSAAAALVVVAVVALVLSVTTSGTVQARLAAVGVTPAVSGTETPPSEVGPEPSGGQASGGSGGRPACEGPSGTVAGTWQYAPGGPTFGRSGAVRSFRVAVESTVPVPVESFTAVVDSALGDPRGWTSTGNLMLQRVSGDTPASFTIFLASPWTACRMCLSTVDIRIGGEPYTSCQVGGQVIINADRFLTGSPKYLTASDYPLSLYRQYAINHEVGHQLGHQHERCPGAGQLAPIMQQQTLGLLGCRPNPWPYPAQAPAPQPSTESSPVPSASPGPQPSASAA
jgi:hypothetical protein